MALAAAVERDELVLLDDSLADGALGGVRVDVQPLVEARPAEEVPAERHNGLLRQLEAAPAITGDAAAAARRLPNVGRHVVHFVLEPPTMSCKAWKFYNHE